MASVKKHAFYLGPGSGLPGGSSAENKQQNGHPSDRERRSAMDVQKSIVVDRVARDLTKVQVRVMQTSEARGFLAERIVCGR